MERFGPGQPTPWARRPQSGAKTARNRGTRRMRRGEGFIADLEDHYESGVPVGIILAFLSGGPTTIADVQHKLHSLKRAGDVYEPRDGYLRIVL